MPPSRGDQDEGEGDDNDNEESTPPNGRHHTSRDDPSPTRNHYISSTSQQASRHLPQDAKSQSYPSSREVEQNQPKGVKLPPIRESDQRRPETKSPQTAPPRHGRVSSSSTAAYPSSKRNPQEYIPPSPWKNAMQESTPPSVSSSHPSSSRRSPREYTPPSDEPRRPSALSQAHAHDDRSRRGQDREREREKERRKYSDSDEEPEPFSGKKELHPTFSPAIVRTPKYYSERTNTPKNATPTKSSSTRRASVNPAGPPHAVPSLNRVLQENVPSMLSPLIGATPRPSPTTMPGMDKVSRGEPSSSSSSLFFFFFFLGASLLCEGSSCLCYTLLHYEARREAGE